ncbi:leucine-zipper-like transcriptional regulator 1 homolog isoform X2 [Eretmochelys imbricata]
MKRKTAMCLWKPVPQSKPFPCDRFKHACSICRGFVYLYGGRCNSSLSDFWRYNIASNEWEKLDRSEDGPEELEEHSMVAYQGILYIFGGMVDSAFTQVKIPLWMYDIDSARWTECRHTAVETESIAPANRKGHSAVVYNSSMYIYGGYFDIKGISQEFWALRFDTGEWSQVSPQSCDTGPGPRHGHSAVVYGTGMYLFGGLMGLSEQRDLWKWDFTSCKWSTIRTRYHRILGIGVGFQLTPGFSRASPINHWCPKGKEPQKSPAVSKQRAHFHGYFRQQHVHQPFSNDGGTAIEMKTFSQPLEPLGFYSFQTSSDAELCTDKAQSIFSKNEHLSHCSSSKEQALTADEVTKNRRGTDCWPERPTSVAVTNHPDMLLLIGGKPLSSLCEISLWQMELNSI